MFRMTKLLFLACLATPLVSARAQGFLDPRDFATLRPTLSTGPGSGPILVDTTERTMTLGDGTVLEGELSPDGRAVFCFGSIQLLGDPANPGGVTLTAEGLRPFALLARESFDLAIPLHAGGESANGGTGGRGGPGGGDGGDLGQPGRGFEDTEGLAGDSGGGGGSFVDGGSGGGANPGAGGNGFGSFLTVEEDFPFAGAGGGGSNVGGGGGGGGYVELTAGCSLNLLSPIGDLSGGGFLCVNGGEGGQDAGGGGGGLCVLSAPLIDVRLPITADGGSSSMGVPGGGGGGGLIVAFSPESLGTVDPMQLSFLSALGGLAGAGAPSSQDGLDGLATGYLPQTLEDCNGNGIADACDLAPGGVSVDLQGDGLPEDCQATSLRSDPQAFLSLGSLAPSVDGHADTDALTLTFPGGPTYSGVLANGRCVFTFDEIDVPAGVTVTASGLRPLSLLSQGDVDWSGVLEASGGFSGGPDGRPGGSQGSDGFGLGAGEGGSSRAAGAGHRGTGGDSAGGPFFAAVGGPRYGDFRSLLGGSGGGAASSFRGGGGGGAVELGARACLTIGAQAALICRGGNGEDSAGGGSGGTLLLHAELFESEGRLDVSGGDGGDDGGLNFSAGGGGSGGRIVIDAAVAIFDFADFSLLGGQGGSIGGLSAPGEDGSSGQHRVWPRGLTDCNENGIPDLADLSRQTSADADLDGVPDECVTGTSFCGGKLSAPFDCMSCPCGNAGDSYFAGCRNSAGGSARLVASGLPRLSLDTLRFEMRDANPSTFAVLVSGAQRAPANAINPCFGLGSGVQSPVLNGLRCVVQGVLRHGTRAIDANGDVGVTTNGWGPPNGPAGGLIAANGFQPGQTRHFQIFYRDLPFGGCTETQNTTQGFTVTFEP